MGQVLFGNPQHDSLPQGNVAMASVGDMRQQSQPQAPGSLWTLDHLDFLSGVPGHLFFQVTVGNFVSPSWGTLLMTQTLGPRCSLQGCTSTGHQERGVPGLVLVLPWLQKKEAESSQSRQSQGWNEAMTQRVFVKQTQFGQCTFTKA